MPNSPQRHQLPRIGKRMKRSYKAWYQMPVWNARGGLRDRQLDRCPFCESCRKSDPPLIVPATDVDHIRPHRGNWELFVDPENLQSLCHSCHSVKTGRGE